MIDFQMIERRLYNKEVQHTNKWRSRCNKCLTACCFFPIQGYQMIKPAVTEEDDDLDTDQMRRFWTYDFIIMNDDLSEEIQEYITVCPLSIESKCFIYDDRPKMCKVFYCRMATKWINFKEGLK